MRKRLFFISLALALVLTTLMPAAALATKPGLEGFEASGTIAYITPGKVLPAGKTGKWVVVERELGGSLSGDINGAFTMDYKAIVESLLTQAGTLHGTLAMDDGSYVLQVKGEIQPLVWEGWYLPPGVDPDYPDGIPYLRLTIGGEWRFTNGTWGRGDFEAWAIFIPTAEGHVGFITASDFTMTGQWQP